MLHLLELETLQQLPFKEELTSPSIGQEITTLVALFELLGHLPLNLILMLHLMPMLIPFGATKLEDASQITLLILMEETLHLLMEAFNHALLL